MQLANEWIDSNCYQLANRLAFIEFCKSVNINARLLYISFINGFDKIDKLTVKDESEWKKCWNDEYKELKLDDKLQHLKESICNVYIDCHKAK